MICLSLTFFMKWSTPKGLSTQSQASLAIYWLSESVLNFSLSLNSNLTVSFLTGFCITLTSPVRISISVTSHYPGAIRFSALGSLRLISERFRSLIWVTPPFINLAASNISGVTLSSVLNSASSAVTFYLF